MEWLYFTINIATRSNQSTEQSISETNNIDQIRTEHSVSSNITSPISVDEIFAEDRGCDRVKGKWLRIHHHMELMLELFTMITATLTQTT